MKHKILLILILILATFLRFYKLGNLPNAYSPDELSQAYTAYSILQTGADEWGNTNWLNLRSFGDYKPPLQTLLMIPSVKFFGLTPFAARFPNAFLSLFTVLLIYLIANKLFKNKNISLLSALFMTISPWALPMSRIALEANLVVFIVSLAFYLLLLASEKQKIYLYLFSSLFFGISLFTYHSSKIFTPLFLILLIIFYQIYKYPKKLISFLLPFIFLLGILFWTNSQITSNRTGDIAIFNPTDNWAYVSNSQFEITQNGLPYIFTKLFYNKFTYLYETFLGSYLSYFSPQFLLTQGPGETTYGMIPGYGVLGLIPYLGLILCLVLLIQKKLDKSFQNIVLLLLTILIAPSITAIAKSIYSANRASLMMPFIQIISAAGLVLFIKSLPTKFQKVSTILSLFIFLGLSSIFIVRYFYQGNQILGQGMLYGHKEANQYIQSHPSSTVIYSRKLSEPQAYAAFFNQIDPKITQIESKNWLNYQKENLSFLDQLGEYNLDKFIFREINIPSDSQLPNTIIIGRPEEFRDVKPDYIIYYPDHSKLNPAIYIYQTKNEI
jgi:4-amino-4-deoxy-L-arabinose transferase-like glycosyltransferase